MRTIALIAYFLASATSTRAQLVYDATILVHGLNDSGSRWNYAWGPQLQTAEQIMSASVNLKQVIHPNLPLSTDIAGQAAYLRSYTSQLLASSPSRVIVAHSYGGLVARKSFLDAIATGGYGIKAMVTVGTPHNGTFAANNADLIRGYLDEVTSKLTNVSNVFGTTFLGTVAAPIVANQLKQRILGYRTQIVAFFPSGADSAVRDARTTSGTIAALQADTRDASIPRTFVAGTLPSNRNFALRLYSNLSNQNFSSLVTQRNYGKSILHTCKHAGYFSILTIPLANACGKADRVVGNLDARLMGYTVGFQANGKVRNVPFDGVVAVERASYPGVTNTLDKFFPSGDHFGLINDQPVAQAGLLQALFRVGMRK